MRFLTRIKNAFKKEREKKLATERKAMERLKRKIALAKKPKPSYMQIPEMGSRAKRKASMEYVGPTIVKKKIKKKKEYDAPLQNKRFETLVDGTKAMVVDIANVDTARLMIRPFGIEAARTKGITALVIKVGDPKVSDYIREEHPEARILTRKDGNTFLFLKVPYHRTGKTLGRKKRSK